MSFSFEGESSEDEELVEAEVGCARREGEGTMEGGIEDKTEWRV